MYQIHGSGCLAIQTVSTKLICLSRSQAVRPSILTCDFHVSLLIFTNRIANDVDDKIAKNPIPNSMAIYPQMASSLRVEFAFY